MKLSRISRVVRILTTFQSGHYYTADELAGLLKVSRRTVFRDLKELQAIGVPYRFDAQMGGYSIDPEFFLPAVDLNLQEALSLLMLVHKTRSHLPIPFKSSALWAGLKIENNLPRKIRQYCSTTLQHVSIRPHSHAPTDSLDKLFSQLQEAIRKNRKVKLHYASIYERADITTVLSPYHLMYNHRAWYVLGESSLHKSLRTFKLNRIKELRVLDKCFVQSRKFDVQDYLGRSWSMIPEGKMYHVRLRFSPKVARNVSEVRWHSTQKQTQHEDGSVVLEFRVDGISEISWWVLGYGDQVEVLSPAVLRRRIAGTAKQMLSLNS